MKQHAKRARLLGDKYEATAQFCFCDVFRKIGPGDIHDASGHLKHSVFRKYVAFLRDVMMCRGSATDLKEVESLEDF